MKPTRNPAMPDREAAARDAARAASEAAAALGRLSAALREGLETPSRPAPNAARHRAEHRPGRPGKIESDRELREFVAARIDHMGFPELAEAVAAHFPPERRVSSSSIHRWWVRSGLAAARRGATG